MIPVIILGGIYGGVFTPTEAAAIAGVYGVIVGLFIYREIKPSDLIYIMYRSVLMCAPVLLIIGISTGFGRILTITQVPVMIADAILGLTSSKILVLLLINVLLLIVGTFMETNAAIIILTPILLPLVLKVGVDPIHFGVVLVCCCGVGFSTPPLGENIFIASGIADTTLEDISYNALPFVFVTVGVIILCVFVPDIVLFLPRMMY